MSAFVTQRTEEMAKRLKAHGWGAGTDGIASQVIALDHAGVPEVLQELSDTLDRLAEVEAQLVQILEIAASDGRQ